MKRKTLFLLIAVLSIFQHNFCQRGYAVDHIWTRAVSEEWANSGNWNPVDPPSSGEIAIFDGSNSPPTGVVVTVPESFKGILYTGIPTQYTITLITNSFEMSGGGVDNSNLGLSALLQSFVVLPGGNELKFTNGSSADINSSGKVKYTLVGPGSVMSLNGSNAGAADIILGNTDSSGLIFNTTSSAESATITAMNSSNIQFNNSSTPASSTITLDHSGLYFSRDVVSPINSSASVALSNSAQLSTAASVGALTLSKLTSSSSTDTIIIGGTSIIVNGLTFGDVINGVISGAGIFAFTGGGNLTITNGNNSYLGGTFVDNGILRATTDSLPPGGTVQTQANGTIDIRNTVDGTFTGTITNFGQIIYDGSANAILSGNITQNGDLLVNAPGSGSLRLTGTTINLGSVQVIDGTLYIPFISCPSGLVASGGNLVFTGTGGNSTSTFINDGTITYQGTGTATLVSPDSISGTGNLIVNAPGSGQLYLASANTYTGTTSVQDGILTVNNGALSSNTTTVSLGAFLEFSYTAPGIFIGPIVNNGVVYSSASVDTTLAGPISGTGSVQSVNSLPSSLILRGNNTYSGGTLVTAGSGLTAFTQTLPTTGARQINATGILTIDNSSADNGYGGSFTNNGTMNINTTANVNFTNVISGTGIVNINSVNQTIKFSGLNTYTGATNIQLGTLDISQTVSGTNPSPMNINLNGKLNMDQASSTVGTYSGGVNGSGTFTVNQDGGTGTVYLTGPTTFTGTTTVINGTLAGLVSSLPSLIAANTNATVDIEQPLGTGTYSGVISDNGAGQHAHVGINMLGGTGTVILSGLNTYTGGTTVYNGILQGDTTSLQGDIVVNFGANIDFEQIFGSGTFSGNISGAGGVIVNAPGNKLILDGNNTYSGATDLLSGELEFLRTSSGTLPSLLKIGSGAILDIEQAASTTGTYIGGTEGGGLLTINHYGNTGTVFLTGPTTLTGQTVVYRGELAALTTSLPLNVAVSSNALVDIEQPAGTGTYSGVISNNGPGSKGQVAINKHGGVGKVILTGPNTYSGGTTVYNGILQGTVNSIQGNIAVNSSSKVDFEQTSGQGIYKGNISGAGGVVINSVAGSTGTIWFTGNNSYTGGTLVSRGTLKGDTRSLQGTITDNARVVFEQNINGEFNGAFLGNGIVEKQGVGKLTFNTSSASFTGTINVREGRLALQSILGGDVFVFSGGVFSGNGSVVGDVTVKSGGIIAPGNSPGTLFVGGDYLQESGGIYLAQFDSFGQSSLIDVQGQATLEPGAILICETASGAQLINTQYTILTADGGLNGIFTDVNSTNPLIDPIVTYDSNNAYINFQIEFNDVAKTYNQNQVANQLNQIPMNPSPELQEMLQALATESVVEAGQTLTQMAGVQYTNLILTAELANKNFLQKLFDPLRAIITANPCKPYDYCCYQRSYDLWASMSAGRTFIHGNSNAPGFNLSEYAIACGIQSSFTRCFTAGAAVSYEKDNISYRSGGSGKNSSLLGAIYGLYRPVRFYVLGDLTFGYNNNRVSRTIDVGNLRYRPKAKTKVFQTTVYTEIGTDYGFKRVLVQPFLGLEIGHYHFGNINERGGSPLALSIRGKSRTTSYSRLGLHLTSAPNNCGLSMGVDLAWRYRLTSLENNNRQHFMDFGTPFTIQGTPLQRNSFETILYVNKDFGKHWTGYAEASAEGWDNSFSYNFVFGVQANW